MTAQEFESYVCSLYQRRGFWALNIPKNKFGAQPFDVLAIKGSKVLAIDCKLCSQKRLPLKRIEDNQWLSFEALKRATDAECGFVCLYDGQIYYIPFDKVKMAQELGHASVPLF